MPLVDYERVVVRLRQEMVGRQGIGADGLLALIGRLEAECAVEEGLPERALRLYGSEIFELIKSGTPSAPQQSHASASDDVRSAPSIAAHSGTKGAHDGGRNSAAGHRREAA